MAVHLSFVLILAGFTGIHSITTVSKVSVRAGGSITIPCVYDSQYRNHVKYLCKGYYWSFCPYAVKTNQPHSSGMFSISDDKTQRIFTVTIKALTDKDTDYYWCAVEINQGDDIKKYFHLSVTRGTPSLYVDHQQMTGFNGDSITISCNYTTAGEMKWCRLGRNCVTGSSGSIDGTRVTIHSGVRNVFTVTMSGLTTQSRGWYLCVKGDFHMPVYVTVTEKPTTTTLATATHLTSSSPTSEPVTLTPVMGDEASTTEQHSVSVNVRNSIISLSLLIFIAMVALFIWLMLRKHKPTKAVSPRMTEQSYPESDVDVTYSSVVIMRRQGVRRVEANDENVIYSTLA